MTDRAEAIQRLREHCVKHRKSGRAQFSTAGMETLLAMLDALEKERDELKAALERRGEIIFGQQGD